MDNVRGGGAPGGGFGRGWVPVARDIGLPGDEAVARGAWGVSTSLDTNGFESAGFAGAGDPVLTPACKARFLDELSRHGNVRVAGARVGVSRSGLYLARRRDALFAAGWRAALGLARQHAEAVLAERALEGVEEPVFFRGELIAVRRRYDARLLLAHLARLDALCGDGDAEAAAGEFDRLLAAVADLPEAAAPPDCPSREAAVERAAFRAGARGLGDKRTAALLEEAAAQWDAAEAALLGAVDGVLAGGGPDGAGFEVKGLGDGVSTSLDTNGGGDCLRAGHSPLDSVHSVQHGRGPGGIDLGGQPSMIGANNTGEDPVYARYPGAVHRPVRPDRLCRPGGNQEPGRQDPTGPRRAADGPAGAGRADRHLGAGRGRGGRIGRAGAVEPPEPQARPVGQAGVELRAGPALYSALGAGLTLRQGARSLKNSQTRTFQNGETLAEESRGMASPPPAKSCGELKSDERPEP